MSAAASPSQFRKIVVIVASAHLLLILLLSFWSSLPVKAPETITLINLESFDGVSSVESTKGPAPTPQVSKGPVLGPPGPSTPTQAPAPAAPSAPEPEPAPEPPTPQPATPEPPTPAPAPVTPKVAPPAPVAPPPRVEPTFQTKPKVKPKIKVSTKVVARANESSDADSDSESAPAPSKSSSKTAVSSKSKGGHGKGVSASEISGHLGSSLSKGGLGGAVEIGPVSQPGGGPGNFGSYYTLIRQQMTDAWDKPIHLNQPDLSAVLKITIEKDGRISNVSLLTSSGQSEFDRSIMAAAERVGRIREPLPEGMEGHVSIRFRLQD